MYIEIHYKWNKYSSRYQTEFGFTMADRKILVNDIRVRGIGQSKIPEEFEFPKVTNLPVPEKVIIILLNNYM